MNFLVHRGARKALAISLPLVAGFAIGSVALAAIVPTSTFSNPQGSASDFTQSGTIDTSNPFFNTKLGSNGRSCFTCHVPQFGWTVDPAFITKKANTSPTDPLFSNFDATDCPTDHPKTTADLQADSTMLLSRALFRVTHRLPSNSEFTVTNVSWAFPRCTAPIPPNLALFRQAPPTINQLFDTSIMLDGRSDNLPINTNTTLPGENLSNLITDLSSQAQGAILGHLRATVTPNPTVTTQIAQFEVGVFTAQIFDKKAGMLNCCGATGGAPNLSNQTFFVGMNDPNNPGFTPDASTLYPKLGTLPNSSGVCSAFPTPTPAATSTPIPGATSTPVPTPSPTATPVPVCTPTAAQASITRGEQIFNERQFQISNVAGFNDPNNPGTPITGTCTSCHDTPNIFNNSSGMFMDLGISSAPGSTGVPGFSLLTTTNLPVYTLQNTTTHQTIETTDPGRAMITGKWADINEFKVPILRALSDRRGPFFHNNSAPDLTTAINFYNTRFNIGLSAQDQADLLAYLQTL